MAKGFLTKKGAGALYPDGSSEGAAPLWGSTTRQTKPVLELETLPETYKVVGRFKEAGACLGKEDFEITRTGTALRVKGNPQNDPQSCASTAGLRSPRPNMPVCARMWG